MYFVGKIFALYLKGSAGSTDLFAAPLTANAQTDAITFHSPSTIDHLKSFSNLKYAAEKKLTQRDRFLTGRQCDTVEKGRRSRSGRE
jgi:hypothetical protein